MKNFTLNKTVLILLALLFISADVCADHTLPGFDSTHLFKQEQSRTCWAACVRMVMSYYNNRRSEDDIIRFAFRLPADAPIPNDRNTMAGTSDALRYLLLDTRHLQVNNLLTADNVRGIINDNRPILAGWRYYNSDNTLRGAHMVLTRQ